jgi:hypothetical protein
MLHLQVESFFTGQAQYIAKDRGKWWQIGDVLCPIGNEEDKLSWMVLFPIGSGEMQIKLIFVAFLPHT